MFEIYLTSDIVPETEGKAVYGKIQIGAYKETLISSLAVWSRKDYRASWRKALQHILDGEGPAALITNYVKPVQPDDFLVWWPLYPAGDKVYVRNEMLFYRQLKKPFSPDRPWDFIRERLAKNPEGFPISEWTTTLKSIRDCLGNMPK